MYGTSPFELLACQAMLQGLVYLDEFSYSAAWIAGTNTALGASATVDVQVQINSDSDFVAQEMNFVSFSALDTIIASPDYLLTLIRAGSGRELMNQPQHLANMSGNYYQAAGSFPGKAPMTGLYQANTTLTCRLQNRTVTASNRADLTLRGFKVFYQTNARGEIGTRQGVFGAL